MTTADYNRSRQVHAAWQQFWGTPSAPCVHTLSWVNVQRLERPDGTRYLSETCPDCGALLAERPAPNVEAK